MIKLVSILFLVGCSSAGLGKAITPNSQAPETISLTTLKNFSDNPTKVKDLLQLGLTLAGKNLGYKYGSSDPKNQGMDCSGTVYYLLNQMGVKEVPRSSHTIYQWAWQEGNFHAVNSHSIDSFEFKYLKPGDLLFWSGTYAIDHDPNVTHVMIYLGKDQNNKSLMVGASNGRSFHGRKIYGVSVFDFDLPVAGSTSRFLGYSCIPKLSC